LSLVSPDAGKVQINPNGFCRPQDNPMPVWTKEEALEIAIKNLGEQYRDKIKITDKLPRSHNIHMAHTGALKNCWVIYVPFPIQGVGPSRVLCISKKSGKIIFDGIAGE
jgi:hypothetical protein